MVNTHTKFLVLKLIPEIVQDNLKLCHFQKNIVVRMVFVF